MCTRRCTCLFCAVSSVCHHCTTEVSPLLSMDYHNKRLDCRVAAVSQQWRGQYLHLDLTIYLYIYIYLSIYIYNYIYIIPSISTNHAWVETQSMSKFEWMGVRTCPRSIHPAMFLFWWVMHVFFCLKSCRSLDLEFCYAKNWTLSLLYLLFFR